MQAAATTPQGVSAKLMRFASALAVDAKHQVALTTSAIAKNMAVAKLWVSLLAHVLRCRHVCGQHWILPSVFTIA